MQHGLLNGVLPSSTLITKFNGFSWATPAFFVQNAGVLVNLIKVDEKDASLIKDTNNTYYLEYTQTPGQYNGIVVLKNSRLQLIRQYQE